MIRFRSTAGLTLVETLVAITIFTLLLLMIFFAVQTLYQTNSYALAQANEVDSARRGLIRFIRDVREMTYAEDGAFPIAVMEPHRIGFYSDLNGDREAEYIEYELSSTTLYKRTHHPTGNPPVYNYVTPDLTETLSDYVQNSLQNTSTFLYYDNTSSELNVGDQLTDVRYIRVQLIVNIDPLRSPGEFMLRNSVAPRNLKDNL